MPPKTKIETALSANDLQDFCRQLADTPNLTLERLKELAAKRGISVSLMGASRFRSGALDKYMAKVQKARDLAMQLAEVESEDTDKTLADNVSAIIIQEVFDTMVNGSDEDGKVDLDAVSKIVSRLRSGDHRQKALSVKLREYERKEKEREEAKKKALENLKNNRATLGLSREAIEAVEKQMKLF